MPRAPSSGSPSRIFLGNVNNAIARGKLPVEDRNRFGLALYDDRVPALPGDSELKTWAQKIAAGEAARIAAGGAPMAWPAAAEVAALIATFDTQAGQQSAAKDSTDREQQDVELLLPAALAAVEDLWDTIEFNLRREPAAPEPPPPRPRMGRRLCRPPRRNPGPRRKQQQQQQQQLRRLRCEQQRRLRLTAPARSYPTVKYDAYMSANRKFCRLSPAWTRKPTPLASKPR